MAPLSADQKKLLKATEGLDERHGGGVKTVKVGPDRRAQLAWLYAYLRMIPGLTVDNSQQKGAVLWYVRGAEGGNVCCWFTTGSITATGIEPLAADQITDVDFELADAKLEKDPSLLALST
jgi:hypothetical protein